MLRASIFLVAIFSVLDSAVAFTPSKASSLSLRSNWAGARARTRDTVRRRGADGEKALHAYPLIIKFHSRLIFLFPNRGPSGGRGARGHRCGQRGKCGGQRGRSIGAGMG